MEIPLRRLVDSPGMMTAFYWQKLLDLIAFLQAQGPQPLITGFLLVDALSLIKRRASDPNRDRRLRQFLEEWRPDPSKGFATGGRLHSEYLRRFPLESTTRVTIWPGLAGSFAASGRTSRTLSEDLRIQDFAEVEQALLKAFG